MKVSFPTHLGSRGTWEDKVRKCTQLDLSEIVDEIIPGGTSEVLCAAADAFKGSDKTEKCGATQHTSYGEPIELFDTVLGKVLIVFYD